MMNKSAYVAIIKKDFKSVTDNKNMFAALLIMPLVFTVILPSIFIILIHFGMQDSQILAEVEELANLFGVDITNEIELIGAIINNLLPSLFLMIPIMAASVTSACAFVGEKEKRTLETLLFSPLTLSDIFRAKVLASFLLSMLVALISFAVMLLVIEVECMILSGELLFLSVSWLVLLLLLTPSVSLIAITLIVRGSAKAQSVEQSQQSAVFLVLPVLLLVISQATGLLLISVWILLALGVVCAAIAFVLLKKSMTKFTYEALLK